MIENILFIECLKNIVTETMLSVGNRKFSYSFSKKIFVLYTLKFTKYANVN